MKKAVTLLLALTMLLALVACGGSNNAESPFDKIKNKPSESQVEELFGKCDWYHDGEGKWESLYRYNAYVFLGHIGELNVYYTSPLKPNAIIYTDDYEYLNDHNHFEAAKAYDHYLNRGDDEIDIFWEYTFNSLILGGEAIAIKRVTLELSDLFIQYQDVDDHIPMQHGEYTIRVVSCSL